MSYAGYFRSVIKRQRVVVSAVSLPGVYVMCDSDSRKRGRERRARSMWSIVSLCM